MKVSVIIPTLNEAESIGEVIDSIPTDFADVEVLVIDGDSKDGTQEISTAHGATVINEPRPGYGRAYKTGFANASGEIIATLDGDATYPAEEIPRLVKILADGNLDFITCDRLSKLHKTGIMSTRHRLGNWTLTFLTNLLFGLRIVDSQSGMWVFRKEILKKLELTDDGMPLSEEIKIEAWLKRVKFKEVSVDYRIRKGEVKLKTWGDGYKNLKFLIRKILGRVGSPEIDSSK
ncbi:MAG: glycosyltransferase family 2 protein [Thermoplasmata archaeon]